MATKSTTQERTMPTMDVDKDFKKNIGVAGCYKGSGSYTYSN